MVSLPSYWSSEAATARAERFGRFLLVWRLRCGWTQYELPAWGRACGFVCPAIGTMSQLERGTVKTPQMALFAGLAEANSRLAAEDFTGITDGRLKERIKAGVAITNAAGAAWGFDDFAHAFHLPHLVNGELWEASSNRNLPAPELTDAELERVNDQLRNGLALLRQQVGAKALKLAVAAAPPDQRDNYGDALFFGYDRETLELLWDPAGGEWSPLQWLSKLNEGRGPGQG